MPASVPAGLLGRLDALVALVDQRRGLVLASDGTLARSEARAVARVAGLAPAQAGEAGLLVALAVAVGVVRIRGLRVELTALRPAWDGLEAGLRAGIVYAAWCHRVPWSAVLGPDPPVERLHSQRLWVLRLLYGLPAGADVEVAALAAGVADRAGLPDRHATLQALAAAFLDPLAALGVAQVLPPPPSPPTHLRLGPDAHVVLGSALIAAGEEVPLTRSGCN